MSQQRWGHDVYQDGYQDTRRTLPSRGNQAGSFSPAAKETSMSGDECDTVKCRSRRPPSGRHRAADLPVRSPMDRPKDDEVQAVKAATTPAKQRPRSKPKRPDVAIYVPRGRRQQEHANVHACPSEQIAEPKQEKPAKKSAVSSARHTGAFSVPRMRRPQTEKIENQESARVSSIRTDVPPEGDTSQATLIVTGEDSLGDVVKHKTKRKKGSGKTPDEKTGRDTVKKDGKKKRKDGLEQVAPPGEVETKDSGGSEKEIHSLHSHDASVSRSSEYTDTSLLVESGDISCSKTIEDQVESHDALQMVDIDQLQDSVIRCDDHAKTMATELSGQSNAAEKQDKLDQPLGDADQLPGNQENDESHDLAGSCIEAAIPTKQLGEGTDVAGSCSEQLESKTIDKSSVIDEDVCRNVGTKSQGQTAASENEGKDRCEECVPVEDMMVEQCANSSTTCTKRANNNTKELSLDVECNTEPDSQCQSGGDNVSQNFEATMTNKNVVDATSELQLSVCSEETSQDTPLTTDSLTATITDSSCDVTCGGDTSENRDTGDVLVTRDHECCTGDVEAGNSHGRRVDEESGNMEERLECEHENKMKENETDSYNELAGNKTSEQTANEICKSECEKSEQSVCDNKSESKMDVRDDIGVYGETVNNINSGNNVSEDENESVIHNIKSGKDEANESCQLKPSADPSSDTEPAQPQTDITSKTKKVKVEKVKAANSDIGKSPDSASDSHQGHSIAMETEEEDDSWDKLFDDTGEALDPKLVDELTVAVGKVKVQKPQFDYFSFQPKELEMDDDEYSHLVEIYDFPSDLTTTDLVVAFHEYKDQGFDIKWVDDSHAIGIFSSSIAARGALTMSSPFMKVRPISQATRATKLKAKQCTEFLQPYKERPETNASVARSLVAGALGLATRVPKEQREAERRRLREARAKKKQAKQQVVDVWEGRVGGCAMDEV